MFFSFDELRYENDETFNDITLIKIGICPVRKMFVKFVHKKTRTLSLLSSFSQVSKLFHVTLSVFVKLHLIDKNFLILPVNQWCLIQIINRISNISSWYMQLFDSEYLDICSSMYMFSVVPLMYLPCEKNKSDISFITKIFIFWIVILKHHCRSQNDSQNL